MPVAIAIGVDPTIVLSSISKFPYGTDEFAVAGGLRGEAVPLVRCETVDLEVPANAEIVLEGIIRAGYREQEGPFGEFSGYMSSGGQTPVIELTCMTRRRMSRLSLFLESDAAERIELHSQHQPVGWPVFIISASSRPAGARRSFHRERRRQLRAGDLDEEGISRASQRSRLGRVVAHEQGMQVHRRRRRRRRRAQSLSSRMGDELSRPTGARHVHGERRRAVRRRSIDGGRRTFRNTIRAGEPAARFSSTPRANIPIRPRARARGIHHKQPKEMAGVWLSQIARS